MAWNNRDWERWIHQISKDSGCVKWSAHARARMRERKITMPVILDILHKGAVNRVPEVNIKTGYIECRIERFCAGRNIAVIVAIEQELAPSCLVVTIFIVGE
ncbi:DUF4258 domain-containing protein [Pusillimonas sp. MFBS29]|uniref:DUF4258 domain-containing protein n=1 Tax=Pusillimonas sp. MFBS29 TaxID=2886690 RepID=UPI001D0FF6C4|nr:DUF4258 domain-containing protein [Pusillimonas sp. MFBS29]MCC2596253.1 DUF4258 domain-containing protein [Pusillimonas sp. MFBS29]